MRDPFKDSKKALSRVPGDLKKGGVIGRLGIPGDPINPCLGYELGIPKESLGIGKESLGALGNPYGVLQDSLGTPQGIPRNPLRS